MGDAEINDWINELSKLVYLLSMHPNVPFCGD